MFLKFCTCDQISQTSLHLSELSLTGNPIHSLSTAWTRIWLKRSLHAKLLRKALSWTQPWWTTMNPNTINHCSAKSTNPGSSCSYTIPHVELWLCPVELRLRRCRCLLGERLATDTQSIIVHHASLLKDENNMHTTTQQTQKWRSNQQLDSVIRDTMRGADRKTWNYQAF